MVILYYIHFSHPLTEPELEKHLHTLPNEILCKFKSFRRWQDAHACLFGKLLLLKGLNDFNVNKSLSDLKYTKYNRPYFDHSSIDFNISHSSNSVVCAVSNEGIIGVDIEEIRPVKIMDFRKQFQKKEWDEIISARDIYKKFFTYWTKKEAAIKADGRGLNIPLNKVYVEKNSIYIENKMYQSHELLLSANSKCYLAAESEISFIHLQLNYL